MSSRGMEHSGGAEHIRMVKETIKLIVDRFSTMNRILIQFEPWHKVNMTFHQDRFEKYMNTPQLDFRPDILLHHTPPDKRKADSQGMFASMRHYEDKIWESILDSNYIVFEVETRPKTIFRNNKLKLEYYRRMKDERQRKSARLQYAFVLVVPEGSRLPEDTEPFDEVWKIPKEN